MRILTNGFFGGEEDNVNNGVETTVEIQTRRGWEFVVSRSYNFPTKYLYNVCKITSLP